MRDLFERAARRDRAVLLQHVLAAAGLGVVIAVLDQQPVGALAAAAVVLHAHQHPLALEFLTHQREFEVTLGETFRRVFGVPVAAVPDLHRAAAVLALGDGALEVAVVERMILDLHREPLLARIEGGPARHRPGLEHAVIFETKIVMQPRGGVLLNHEAPLV